MATTMKIEVGDPRLPASFWRFVRKSTNGCWHWTGYIAREGYGQYNVPKGSAVRAHRYLYDQLVEPVYDRKHPNYRDVDHECHNRSKSCPGGKTCLHRRCVNPAHLAAKTPRANLEASPRIQARRQQHDYCKRGHEQVGDNLYVSPTGRRACYACIKDGNRRRNPPTGERPGPKIRTRCKHGHELSGDNLYVAPSGTRHCCACRKDSLAKHKAKVHAL